MLVVGMVAWATRYLLFAFGNPAELVFMYYLGIVLHGVCYDFFFVTGQIYVDNTAPKTIQASAQGFITLVTYGVGMLIGTFISGMVVKGYQLAANNPAAGHDWTSVWLVPASMALVIILLFAFFFDGGSPDAKSAA
jgi:sugar phosphate permease